MNNPKLITSLLGLAFIGIGLMIKFGLWKKYFWRTRGGMYGYIPLGLLFILYSFQEEATQLLGSRYWMYLAGFGVLIAIAVWWSLRPPGFLKPAWVHWVESYPKHVIDRMRKEAESDPEWVRHTSSQESIDRWAKELTRINPQKRK